MHTGPPQLHYETIETRARPARIAVVTDSADPDWRDTTVRIVEFLSSIWGGKHSVIIPTDGSTIEPVFWRILEAFSPDYVYFYRKTGADIQISHPEEYAAHVEELVRQYESQCGPSDSARESIDRDLQCACADKFVPSADLCSQIADQLVPFHFKKHLSPLTGHGAVPRRLTSIVDVLPYIDHPKSFASFQVPRDIDAIWWTARTGTYSAKICEQLRSLGIIQETTLVSMDALDGFAAWVAGTESLPVHQAIEDAFGVGPKFIPPDPTRPTPFDLSMSRTGLYGRALSHDAVAERFALVLGDSLADFCLAYCLPRIGHPAIWLPELWINEFQHTETTPLKSCALRALWATPHEVRHGSGLKVCSVSKNARAVSELLEVVKRCTGFGLNDETVTTAETAAVVAGATDALIPYCIDSLNQPDIHPFLGDRSAGAIRSPRPNGFSKLNALRHRWVAEVVAGGRTVPSVPHVAENLIMARGFAGTWDVRVSQGALAYGCPGALIIGEDVNANLQSPEIRLFETFIAVSLIAAANGFSCQLSDKGIYQRDSLEKLGGVSGAAKLFKDCPSNAVCKKFLDHTKPKKGVYDEGCVLSDQRTYLDLKAVQKLMGEHDSTAVRLLDNLVASKVFYRGFVLGCAVCKHVAWYALAQLADDFRCMRCGREQTISRQHWHHPDAPQIFYKLDEIVYQFLKGDGDVVALSLDYMSRNSKTSFNYSPEIRFQDKDSTVTGEIDICAVWDGVLVIGEAKKQGELAPSESETRKTINKYVRLAAMLNARRVVMCTASPEWRSTTVAIVRSAFQDKLAAPVFLTAQELLGKISTEE